MIKNYTDNRTKEQRSYCMKQIKCKNTSPEVVVRKYLHKNGFRYSLHNSNLPGKPDIVLTKYHKIIFVNGCFWHGHENCKYAKTPHSNREFWVNKINMNKKRDKINIQLLKNSGWEVIVVWECQLKKDQRETTLKNLILKIKS